MTCPSCDEFVIIQHISNNNILIGSSFIITYVYHYSKIKYDSVKVVDERCSNCINQPRKLKIVFTDEMVNQGFPKEYTGCICGCDNTMNSALKINQRVINMISEAEQKNIPLPPLPSTISNNLNSNTFNNIFNNNFGSNNSSSSSTSNSYSNYSENNRNAITSNNYNTNNNNSGFIKSSNYNNNNYNYNNYNNNLNQASTSNSNNNFNTPNCPSCNQPLSELTVIKDNENKGKNFINVEIVIISNGKMNISMKNNLPVYPM
ncbi:hypothetical protein PIROE2DRAFT_9398 [Piromyces sp. E2]|nr:hypothetical protein PIROE2DRAFT_9398 [Piromyces sp. E2]|eukprot:OUM63943.1 hypothetical protein PIROE2DRAFT_9398 [Piromyces sp. E2]